MPKNGYRPVEVNPYAQQRYASYYIPPVYSPQQQFPLYSLITPQAWSATHSFIDPTLVGRSSRAALSLSFIDPGTPPALIAPKYLVFIIRLRHFTTTSSSTGLRRTASNRPRRPSPSGIIHPGTGILSVQLRSHVLPSSIWKGPKQSRLLQRFRTMEQNAVFVKSSQTSRAAFKFDSL